MSKKLYRMQQRIKPIGKAGIDKVRQIIKNGYAKVNEVMIDTFSAGVMIAVYDALGPDAQAKYEKMPVVQAADVSFKLYNRYARA